MKIGTHKKFHLLVRALIVDDGRILVARVKKGGHSFLPGGHHEVGETLADCLKRELHEELGIDATVGSYIGVVENNWSEGDTHHYEINHVFLVTSNALESGILPESREDHLEFFWLHQKDFGKENLLPVMLRPRVVDWLAGKKDIWSESNFE